MSRTTKRSIYNIHSRDQTLFKNIYFTANKSNKINDYKCILNLRNDIYKLCLRLTSNTNQPLTTELSESINSLNVFRRNIQHAINIKL